MKIGFVGVQKNWTLCALLGFFLLFSFGNSYLDQGELGARENPNAVPVYDRIDEVKRECKLVFPSGFVLKPNDNRDYGIEKELSFVNGDWDQENGKSPLLPFDARGGYGGNFRYRGGNRYGYPYGVQNISGTMSPVNLISFWVTDVDREHKVKDSLGVNAVLYMGKTVDGSFMNMPYEKAPHFHMYRSHSELSVAFQGIYMESREKNRGERVLCLLGNALLPSRKPDDSSSDPWDWAKDSNSDNDQLSVLQDDQVLLILRYPKKLALTSMEIRGEMRSLNQKSSLKYFDKVKISSQLGDSATYKFESNELVSKACNPYPYEDKFRNTEIEIYKGTDFCSLLKQLTQGEAFVFVPNWKCNSTKEVDCNKLGPFGSTNKAINATKGGFKDVHLTMQKIKCEKNSDGLNKVSAVFRAISPSENVYYAEQRTGLSSNMTLSAEGIWKESSGQLCMIGCVADRCDSRICLYIPISFSIKQQSIIVGSVSSINNNSPSYFPLQFEKVVQPNELWDRFQSSHFHYEYTKIDLAGTVLEKYESFTFSTVIKSSLLTFPKLENQDSYLSSLAFLFEDLALQTTAVPDPVPRSTRALGTELKLDIVSIGPMFGRFYTDGSTPEEEAPYHTKAEYTEKGLLLNVSAQLSLTGKPYTNYSLLFLEGIYDPHVGKLFTIGCRDVRASQEILFDSMDLENGLDCLIEVVISYPPTTSRWLVNPTAKISIKSQRTEDDPLYFNSTNIQTLPIMYRRQREDILSRKGVEGILRSLTLSLAIACIFSQVWYIAANTEPVPYMSLVMLGVQAMGYSLPLVTGAEALFKKMASESDHMAYDPESNQWFQVIDYTVKILVLVCFLLTLRLCQKVWKSRARLLARINQESQRLAPTDKKVFISTFTVHLIGYIAVLALHRSTKPSTPAFTNNYVEISYDKSGKMWGWAIELEEYIGLVQDFFLLPQIIGNFIWAIDCKPLRKVYYIGITIVRLLPHVYDYIRAPVTNPYFSEDYEFVNPNLDFFSRFGDIAIPATSVLLAVIVFIQQRWSYEKLSDTLKFRGVRILPMGSKTYQRLPTKVSETELASGVNEETKRLKDRDEED